MRATAKSPENTQEFSENYKRIVQVGIRFCESYKSEIWAKK